MRNNSVTIIGSAGTPARYGGFETLAEQLTQNLSKDTQVFVFCSSYFYRDKTSTGSLKNINRIFIQVKPNGFSSIFYDIFSIIKAVKYSRNHLILGGSAGIVIPFFRLLFFRHRFIFHPDGLEWKRKKWNLLSKYYLKLCIYCASSASHKLIIDNKALNPFYKRWKNKICNIAYGGNQYNINYSDKNAQTSKYWLTIARAEPENNLDIIGEYFSKKTEAKWLLISNLKSTSFGKNFYFKYKNIKNIILLDSCYDNKILSEYLNNCYGYIHGHSCGGTNPTLTTAMWLKKPLICHNNIFNIETTRNKALYFNSIDSLSEAIIKSNNPIKSDIEELFKIATKYYNWKKIADEYYNCIFNYRS